jgi:plasmid stability protein
MDMGQVIIRNLDDDVIEGHRSRARARGVSLEQELRDVLARTASPTRGELAALAERIRALTPTVDQMRREGWELIREDRDSR